MLLVVERRGKSKVGNIVNIASIGSTANTDIWVARHRPGSLEWWMIMEGVMGTKVFQQEKGWTTVKEELESTNDTIWWYTNVTRVSALNGTAGIWVYMYFSRGQRPSLWLLSMFSMSHEGFQPHGGKQSITSMSIFGPYNDPTTKTHVQTDKSECLLMNRNQMDDRVDGCDAAQHAWNLCTEASTTRPHSHHNKPHKPSQQPSIHQFITTKTLLQSPAQRPKYQWKEKGGIRVSSR
jgi:hypothetical protein